jgi:hypothetical protein
MLSAARELPESPSRVVLRSEGSRVVNRDEAQRHFGCEIRVPYVQICAGPKMHAIVGRLDPIRDHDSVRVKSNSLSGLINSVQIACCLMGIEPAPVASMEGCIPKNSEHDKLRHLSLVPDNLRKAIETRQTEIRNLLLTRAPRVAPPS